MQKAFFYFILFLKFCAGTEVKCFICQYFRCEAYDDQYISLLKLVGIEIYSNKKTNFREIFSIFHESFVLFHSPQNRKFDFDFWKSPNKNCKCGNLWQKIKCARATGNKLVFLFWPYLQTPFTWILKFCFSIFQVQMLWASDPDYI